MTAEELERLEVAAEAFCAKMRAAAQDVVDAFAPTSTTLAQILEGLDDRPTSGGAD